MEIIPQQEAGMQKQKMKIASLSPVPFGKLGNDTPVVFK